MKRIWSVLFALLLLPFGVTTSHAALYFPHVDTTPNEWQTEIGVINPGSTTVQGNLYRYDEDGNIVSTTALSLAPGSRRQIALGVKTGADNKGYDVFENVSGSPVGYTKFTQNNGGRVAIPAVDSVSTGNLYVTHIDWAPWWTGLSLVNTTTADKTLTIRFNTGQTRTVTLAAKQHKSFAISELLIDTDIKSAVIENASGIVGLELFGNGKQLDGVPLMSGTASTLFYPHVERSGGWWTGIVAYNPPTSATTQITVNQYAANGTLLGSPTRSLGAGQKFIWPDPSAGINFPANTAWCSIQSQDPLIGFELFGNGDLLAGYSVVGIDGEAGIFPKLEKNGWTGIAFVNTENRQVTITTRARNNAGTELATVTKTLNAHQKWVGNPVSQTPAASLFPWANRDAVNAATYLSFSADGKVAGFQLNGDATKVDALPALVTSSSGGPDEVIDEILDLLKNWDLLGTGMATVTDIIGQILGTEPGSTCPVVTVVPPLEGLSNLPSAITITASYGTGCTATDGATMSGQVVLAVTNLAVNEAAGSINLDYALTATNLRRNGVLVLSGSVSGHIALNLTTGSLSASVHFANFQLADSSISGDLTIAATDLESGPITISFTNLTAAGYTVTSGTLAVTTTGANTIQIDANLNTSEGVVDVTLTVLTEELSGDRTRMTVNTTGPGTISGYTFTMTNVIMDTGVCNGYPSSGSMTVSQGGSSATKTFTSTCPPVVMMEQASPAQEKNAVHDLKPTHGLDPFLNFSKYLYEYLTPKR